MRALIGSMVVALASAAPAQAVSTYTINGVLSDVVVRGDGDQSLPAEYGLREGASFSLQMTFDDTRTYNSFETRDFVFNFDGVETTPDNFGRGIEQPFYAVGAISYAGVGASLSFSKRLQEGPYDYRSRSLYLYDMIPGFSLRGVALTEELFSTYFPSTGKVWFIDQFSYLRGGGPTPRLSVGANLSLTSVTLSGTPLMFSVPEPATWASMVAGFGLLGASLRRRRAGRAAAA